MRECMGEDDHLESTPLANVRSLSGDDRYESSTLTNASSEFALMLLKLEEISGLCWRVGQ